MLIGLTGGIGSGKSTIARALAARGYAVYDCDKEAKRLINTDPQLQAAITGLLGPEAFVLPPFTFHLSPSYNTAYVASRVFAEPELLEKLNAIVHPAVKADILQTISVCQRSGLSAKRSVSEAVCQAKPVFFIESAILYEAGLAEICDKVIVVDAPEDIRIARTIARDYHGEATEENINKVRARIQAQKKITPSSFHLSPPSFIINDGSVSVSDLADMICQQLTANSQ